MRIRFETTMQDYLATVQNNMKNSPTKKSSRRLSCTFCVLFALMGLYFGLTGGGWLLGGLMLFSAILQIAIEPFMRKFMMPGILKKTLKGENARGIIGWHELELLPDGIYRPHGIQGNKIRLGHARPHRIHRRAYLPLFWQTERHWNPASRGDGRQFARLPPGAWRTLHAERRAANLRPAPGLNRPYALLFKINA